MALLYFTLSFLLIFPLFYVSSKTLSAYGRDPGSFSAGAWALSLGTCSPGATCPDPIDFFLDFFFLVCLCPDCPD